MLAWVVSDDYSSSQYQSLPFPQQKNTNRGIASARSKKQRAKERSIKASAGLGVSIIFEVGVEKRKTTAASNEWLGKRMNMLLVDFSKDRENCL